MARPKAPVGAPRQSVVSSGHRARLEALRDRLAEAVEDAGPRDLAPLAGRYQAVLVELAALPDVKEASALDDLASRRAKRRRPAAKAQ